MPPAPPFVHLHVHSAFSLHAGANRIEDLAARKDRPHSDVEIRGADGPSW